MTKKLNKILIIIPILIAFFMQIMLLRPRIVHAATPMTLAADMYIGWACSDGATYPVYSADITDGKGNIASYVGCSVNTMKVSEEGAALKFNLASIHGNITSAVLKIFVSERNGNPILNLIKTADDSWNIKSSYRPNYNKEDIINNHTNIEISTEGLKTFDVTSYINEEHNDDKIASFILTGLENDADNDFAFICDPNSENKPVLDIEYVPYNVIFDSQGGSLVEGIPADYDTTIAEPAAPTKPNYIFGGWYKETACTNQWNFTTDKIADNTTLYAKWNPVKYNVTFDSQDGTPVIKITADYDSTMTEPKEPTNTGYTFGGWYKEPECTTPWNFATDKITGDITLYAKWTISSYTVSFDVNYGTPVKSQTIVYGNKAVEPAAPTRTGYNFEGWYTDSTFTTAFDFENTLITSNTTIYAKWTPISYNVTFNAQGGSEVTGIKADYDSTIAEPTVPTKPNYTFGGWYKEAVCTNQWNFAVDKIAGDITLYAKWNPAKYNVTFDYQDGTPVTKITADYDSKIAEPKEPTKIGHTFGGWYKEPECTNPWNFGTDKIAGNMTLYAKWTINRYTVSFDVNHGSAVESQIINYEGKVVKPAAPTKTGYNFEGWYTDSTFTATFDFENTLITSDITIYAKWTPISYDITFNTKGGSEVTGIKADYDSTIAEPVAPTKPNYTFGGWYKEDACTNQWNFTADKIAGDTILYAKWNPVKYNVTFDYQDGTPVTKITADYDSKIAEPKEPTKIGHTFGGWYKEPECTNPWNFETDKIAGNMTLYAKWTINKYTVSFDANHGSAVESQIINYKGKVVKPAAPTKTGYNFEGWYTDSTFTATFDFENTLITSDITIYAKWAPISYDITFNTQGGSEVTGIKADYDSTIAEPVAPTKLNYIFGGWYKEETYIHQWNFAVDKISGNTTLYAKWNPIKYSVAFDSQGGTPVMGIEAYYNSTISEPIPPIKNGNTFRGWYKEPGCTNLWKFESDKITETTVLYAKWTINSYTVDFEVYGGSLMEHQTIKYEGKVTEPAVPTKMGYNFAGWYTDSSFTTTFDFANTLIISNTTIYAKWTPIRCDVTFDSQGGSYIPGVSVYYGGIISAPTTPSNAGYNFAGWYKESACIIPWNFKTDKVKSNITLYAKWIKRTSPVNYDVTFDTDGGSYIPRRTVNYGSAISEPNNPTKAGYAFGGWYKDPECTVPWNFTTDRVIGDITLYSKWVTNSCKVNFETNGGTLIDGISANYGGTISAPNPPTKTGYTFDGWYKDAECTIPWNFVSDRVTENITLYAKWVVNSYKVIFETNGGTLIDGISVNYGSTISVPSTPQKTNCTFDGWYKDSGFSVPWDFATDKITANTTLYAKWIMNIYTVSYSGNGNNKGSVPIDKNKYKSGDNIKVMDNVGDLLKYGYTFAGWNTKADGTGINYASGSGSFIIKGNTVLYASWVKNNTATIIGTVTDGKAPVNNAVVTLKGRGKIFITRTGTDGRYTIKNIPAGKGFTLTITKAGYKASKIAGIQLMANRITSDMNVILKKLSSEKNITGFKAANQVGKAVIDMKNYKITFHVKYGTNIKILAPSITVSQGAVITPGSGIKRNFTNTVSYTVKAEDGTKQVWIVKCIIDPKK